MSKDPAFLFYPNDWKTPNTYDCNFSYPPEKSGVYLIVFPIINKHKNKYDYNILYVGSAKDLKKRYRSHEVMRMLRESYGYVQFYFKIEEHYREVEKRLIKLIQPKYNIQWR